MTAILDPRIELVRRRLLGPNRIAWRPEDVTRVMAHFGLDTYSREFAAVPAPFRRDASTASPATTPAANGARSFTFTISSSAIDRMGDTIAPSGWQLDAYRNNPVVLWSHASELLPVGRTTKLWLDAGKLKATAELAPADANPNAELVRKAILGGYLAATSVGFLPLKYAFSTAPDRKYGIDFQSQELLEWSICTVPANAECLIGPGQTSGKGMTAAARRRERDLDLIRLGSR